MFHLQPSAPDSGACNPAFKLCDDCLLLQLLPATGCTYAWPRTEPCHALGTVCFRFLSFGDAFSPPTSEWLAPSHPLPKGLWGNPGCWAPGRVRASGNPSLVLSRSSTAAVDHFNSLFKEKVNYCPKSTLIRQGIKRL